MADLMEQFEAAVGTASTDLAHLHRVASRQGRRMRRHRQVISLGGIAALVAALIGGVAIVSDLSSPTTTVVTTPTPTPTTPPTSPPTPPAPTTEPITAKTAAAMLGYRLGEVASGAARNYGAGEAVGFVPGYEGGLSWTPAGTDEMQYVTVVVRELSSIGGMPQFACSSGYKSCEVNTVNGLTIASTERVNTHFLARGVSAWDPASGFLVEIETLNLAVSGGDDEYVTSTEPLLTLDQLRQIATWEAWGPEVDVRFAELGQQLGVRTS